MELHIKLVCIITELQNFVNVIVIADLPLNWLIEFY